MWTRCCIGDVLTLIQNGVNCKQDKSGVGQKITRIETIADSTINYERTGFAKLDEKQRAKARLENDDILFSHINSPIHVGKTAIYDGNEPLFHGINLLRLRTIEEVDSSYFNMFLISLFQSGYWKRTAKQSVNQASVNQTDIKSVQFSYPPLPVQKQIVEKLDAAFADIDKAISATEKNIENAEAFFKCILQKYFASPKEDWLKGNIADFCTLKSGHTLKPMYELDKGELPYLKVADMNLPLNKEIITMSSRYVNTRDVGEKGIIPEGSVIFPKRGGAIKTNKKRLTTVPITADLNIMSVQPNASILPKFLFFYFLNIDMRELGSGSSIPQINNYDISPLPISFPVSLKKQEEICRNIEQIQSNTNILSSTYKKRLADFLALKKSLLNQAFSGESTEDAA